MTSMRRMLCDLVHQRLQPLICCNLHFCNLFTAQLDARKSYIKDWSHAQWGGR